MKKLMFAAAALAAGIAMADVSSANVVGYHSITLYPGWNVVGVNLANMSDSDGYTLDQIFPGNTPGLVAHAQETQADYVQIWENANGKYGDKNYHLYIGRSPSDKDYTWRYNANDPATVKIKSGDAIWFFKRGDQPVTVQCAGEVEFSASGAELTVYPGWNMIGAPYAAALNFNANSSEYWKTSGAVAHAQETQADYIQIWENANGKYGDKNYHLYIGRSPSDKDYTWRYNANDAAPDNLAEMGCGLWYYHRGDTPITLKLTPPYSL